MRTPDRTPQVAIAPCFVIVLALSAPVAAQTKVPLEPFRAVELRGGGMLTLRHGPTQRVTLLQGDLQYTRFAVVDDRLLIDHRGTDCPPEYRFELEIVTPEILGVSVANGGSIQSQGTFPPQPSIEAGVDQGGTVDIRSIAAASVRAAVHSGGRIFTSPRATLHARVTEGGVITYWGTARVQSSTLHGGAVVKGTEADADKPLSQLGPELPPHPALPGVPRLPDR